MRKTSKQLTIWATVATVITVFCFAGCATAPESIPAFTGTGPELAVSPPVVSLGVARLVSDTTIAFRGSGFDPADSVFITMQLQDKPDTPALAVADAAIDENGEFVTEVAKLVKITEFLRADVGINEDMESYIIIDKAPIAAGKYVATAQSMESDKTATCMMTIKGPSLGDSLKDWIGGLLGKIKKR